VVTLFSVLLAVWRVSSLARNLTDTIASMKLDMVKLQTAIVALNAIPILEMRVGMLEKVFPDLTQRVEALWKKTFSLDKHVAVIRDRVSSEHGEKIDLTDSDPPPRGQPR
jgi:uncharacterized coiled-coil protein SlyX